MFKVKATLKAFLGDEEKYPWHMDTRSEMRTFLTEKDTWEGAARHMAPAYP